MIPSAKDILAHAYGIVDHGDRLRFLMIQMERVAALQQPLLDAYTLHLDLSARKQSQAHQGGNISPNLCPVCGMSGPCMWSECHHPIKQKQQSNG